MLLASREDVSEALWLYGEDDLARRLLDVPADLYEEILRRATSPAFDRDKPMTIDRGAALAAVEVLTGAARQTTRRRARPRAALPTFWHEAGTNREERRTTAEQLREILPEAGPPYLGPFIDTGGRPSPWTGGEEQVLWVLRHLTNRRPYVVVGRSLPSSETYAQAYRLGHGRVLVEHRAGSLSTHGHLIAETTASAAAVLASWLEDADWRASNPWSAGVPDVKDFTG